MTKKKILITLQPADYYFFGGEETFNSSAGSDDARNYLVRSNKLPQQTALVGIIRHALFLKGLDIGDYGFRHDIERNDFGKLHKISPLFLIQKTKDEGKEKNRYLLPAPAIFLENKSSIQIESAANGVMGFNGSAFAALPNLTYLNKCGEISTYTSKENLAEYWAFTDNGEKIRADDIFISKFHIGIDKASRMSMSAKKNNNRRQEEDGFYKQEFIKLADGLSFGLVATVDDDVPIEIFNKVMPLGGEGRSALMRAENFTQEMGKVLDYGKIYPNNNCIVLTCDAHVENAQEILDLCHFAVCDAIPFRHIVTRRDVYSGDKKIQEYALANLHQSKDKTNIEGKSKTVLYLLKRGSVLFPKKNCEEELFSMLNQPLYQKIGYNYFHPQTPIF